MLTVQTNAPVGLLAKIKQAIDRGHVVTWTYDKDGDFTHVPSQWKGKAWLRPTVHQGVLTLEILWNRSVPQTQEVYGVYHGRFVEMLLAHFKGDFSTALAN